MQTIGSRIRAEREAQQVSRAELAKYAGIAPTTLSDLELGESKSTTALHKIATRLGLRAEWIETGKGPKHAPALNQTESGARGSQLARLDPAKIVITTRAINRILDRRSKGLTLDLTETLDAELFAEAYAECEAMTEPSEADMVAVVADLMMAREAKRGRESKQAGGVDRGKDRKARAG